jgi:hypothetical protein
MYKSQVRRSIIAIHPLRLLSFLLPSNTSHMRPVGPTILGLIA